MQWPEYRLTKRGVYILLMLASLASLFLLPRSWSDALKHAGQLLVPAQDATYKAAHLAGESLSELDASTPPAVVELQGVQHELASQAAAMEQLREENARLRGMREALLPPSVPLLPAKVVARDIVAWRDTVLVERGSSRGVRYRDWVASRFFVDHGFTQGVSEKQAVIAREGLLGRVEQVSPYMARVQLFSDVDSPRLEVRVGAATSGGKFEFVDYPCSLCGQGRGRMAIEDVPYQYVQESSEPTSGPAAPHRRISVGDLVLSEPGQMGLPEPLVVGRIVELQENPRKRLVYTLIVEPVVELGRVREVFVIPLVPPERVPIRE